MQIKSIFGWSAIVCMIVVGAYAKASEDLNKAQQLQQQSNQQAKDAQLRINAKDDERLAIINQLEQINTEIGQWRLYNAYQQRLAQDQLRRERSLAAKMQQLAQTRVALVPHMIQMQQDLERFVSMDIPWHKESRMARMAILKQRLERSDLTLAQKYQQVLQAYRQELNLGHEVNRYQGVFQPNHGESLQVTFLHVGRVLLAAQTFDGQRGWRWDHGARAWVALNETDNVLIRTVLDELEQKKPLTLLELPVETARNGQ